MPQSTPRKILVIAVPAIGDALLATPLTRTLKKAWPNSEITLMVRKGAEGIIKNQASVDKIETLERRPGILKSIFFIIKNLLRYDIAISTSSSDRTFLIAQFLARKKLVLAPQKTLSSAWKHLFPSLKVVQNNDINIVEQNLKFARLLGLDIITDVGIQTLSIDSLHKLRNKLDFSFENERFVVIHLVPAFDYKKWPIANWKKVIEVILKNKIRVVLSSGPIEQEILYTNSLLEYFKKINSNLPTSSLISSLAGKLDFEELSHLLSAATLYLGPDTSVTHLAAAHKIPVITIFGQTNLSKWAPWSPVLTSTLNSTINSTVFNKNKGLFKYDNVGVFKGDCLCRKYDSRKPAFNQKSPKEKKPSVSCTKQSLCMESIQTEAVINEVRKILQTQYSNNHYQQVS